MRNKNLTMISSVCTNFQNFGFFGSVIHFKYSVSRLNPLSFQEDLPCAPEEHPLQFTYVFSYFVRPPGKFDPEEYSKYVQAVASFASVEQFWDTYR